MTKELDRRTFLKAAAVAAAPALLPALGANNKVGIGWIGLGIRGYAALDWLHTAAPNDVQITAVCDTYQGYITRAMDRMDKVWGNSPARYNDYHDLLRDKNVDAVFIMTPEHLHHDITIAALRAGKHVYLEKPMTHTIEEGLNLVREWKESGKIVQVGTQLRSLSLYKKAKDLVQRGMIGEVHYARAYDYRNALPDNPVWRYPIPLDASPENTDWARFLGPAPKRPWNRERYFQWRLYWDYSGGISTDLLVHHADIINFMLNKKVPISCMASGAIARWKDGREVPDTFAAIYKFPGDLHIDYNSYFGNEKYGNGEQLCGDEGTIEVNNRNELYFTPEAFRGFGTTSNAPEHVRARKPVHYTREPGEDDGVFNHFRNFIQAVLGNEQVITPPTEGLQGVIISYMATLSFRNEKKVVWEDGESKVRFI
jgi:predicted dehydrogenase